MRPTFWNIPRVLVFWCNCCCPEFSLPLSIWLNSGWSGLLLHWRSGLGTARQFGRKGWGVAA
jgi:hypothetical protein